MKQRFGGKKDGERTMETIKCQSEWSRTMAGSVSFRGVCDEGISFYSNSSFNGWRLLHFFRIELCLMEFNIY